MRHLFPSVVRIERLQQTVVNNMMCVDYVTVPYMLDPLLGIEGHVQCRLDLGFLRATDPPIPVEAGRAPDRQGVMFCSVTPGIVAGDRVVTVSGPVQGIFEIRAVPDIAVGYSAASHMELGITESRTTVTGQGLPDFDYE